MRLSYDKSNGKSVEVNLAKEHIVIGRGPDCDLPVDDERVSTHHVEIRLWDQDYVLKDLRSRNGTFVNGQRVSVVTLQAGDRIQIGQSYITFGRVLTKGPTTMIRELNKEMTENHKGYKTILREIVKETKPPSSPA